MITRAAARYIRISPRKTRKVIDLIRGLSVIKAEAILDSINKRPIDHIKRLLRSAVANANVDKRNNISPSDLYISLIKADGGPMLKRYRAATMGRASTIRHRTTHLILELDTISHPEKKKTDEEMAAKKATKAKIREKVN